MAQSDGDSELESRERRDGPSTKMEAVSPLFHVYNVHVSEWSAFKLQGRFSFETEESDDDDFAAPPSQHTCSQNQTSQQIFQQNLCCMYAFV